MSIRYNYRRQTCRCGRCARCTSGLSDNFTDAECEAYNFLRTKGIAGWATHNPTGMILDFAKNRRVKVVEFAREHGFGSTVSPGTADVKEAEEAKREE